MIGVTKNKKKEFPKIRVDVQSVEATGVINYDANKDLIGDN